MKQITNKLDKFQIETLRGVLRDYWKQAGHTPEAPDTLCDMALLVADPIAPTESNQHVQLAKLADDIESLQLHRKSSYEYDKGLRVAAKMIRIEITNE